MASSAGYLADFFAELEQQESAVIIREFPRFDLDLYIQNYSGATRFERLLLIGKCCVPLCIEALKAAVLEAKEGLDVSRYKEAWDCVRKAAPDEPEAIRDDIWIEKTEWSNKSETIRLENELKGYRNNLIKESIRMGNEDLGKHFEKIGRLNDAAEAYSRMRQDVSHNKHIVEYARHLVDIALRRRDWSMVLANMSKIFSTIQNGDDSLSNYTALMSGIASLGIESYSNAARHFLQMDGMSQLSDYSHIASPNDIAIYGGLAALATMDRVDLQERLLQSSNFRPILDYEPGMRKAVTLFYNGRYADCLSILETFRNDCLLDIYLQKHVPTIFSRIRSRCIVNYFAPFSCVTLRRLSEAFSASEDLIAEEVASMIRDGSLNARINAKDKLLVAVRPNARLNLQNEALGVARRYEQEAQEHLRRISLVAAGLEVASPRNPTFGHRLELPSQGSGNLGIFHDGGDHQSNSAYK